MAVVDFQKRLAAYLGLHNKEDAVLPALPNDATPRQIDQHQRQLGVRIIAARGMARQGELFTPAVQQVVRELLVRVFGGPAGKQLRDSVMDENPRGIRIRINSRYPDAVPLSTMPPAVLEELPKLPPEVEYRFLGAHLILFDVPAHLIVDFIPNALPSA